MKVVLLIKYSDKKIIFRKIKFNFGLQNWVWKRKMSNFWQSSIKKLYKTTMAGIEDYPPKAKAPNFAPVGAIFFWFQNF